ncbi:MAG: divergent polysaccharide deacetylase family protein [Smithellaceae bacterium]
MKLLQRLLKGLLIFLIIVFIAAIIYVLQWKEETAKVVLPKKEAKQAEQSRVGLPEPGKKKLLKETPIVPESLPGKEKEKIVISKIGKTPLRLRQVAIIIDDIGNDLGPVRQLLKIDADITFAVLPLCSHSRDAAEALHLAHREILLHLPMEPSSYPREKPGNGALFTDMNDQELLFQVDKDLASVPYVSGVNNHMGSKFMGDEEKLKLIFERLKGKNLFFIDSRTTPHSKAFAASEKTGLPLASRKIFLDNKRDYKEIYEILAGIARDTEAGDVSPMIIIGHPHPETIRAIKNATNILREKGVVIVPASRLIKNKARQGSS